MASPAGNTHRETLFDVVSLAGFLGISDRRVRQLAAQHDLGRKYGKSGMWLFDDNDVAIMRLHVERAGWHKRRKHIKVC